MKRALLMVLLLGSCGGEAQWPEAERVAFIENCERTSGGRTDYCACLLEKVEERYPDINDAGQLSINEITELAGECQ
ncbi:MAG: hypothetical protein ACRDI3_01535 [Actinomycetota bacterium]